MVLFSIRRIYAKFVVEETKEMEMDTYLFHFFFFFAKWGFPGANHVLLIFWVLLAVVEKSFSAVLLTDSRGDNNGRVGRKERRQVCFINK